MAYIDEVEENEGGKVQKVYYSVLVKAVDNLDQVNIEKNPCSFFFFFFSCGKTLIILVLA